MKYIPSMVIVGAIMLSVVTPALADRRHSDDGARVQNSARVTNLSVVAANSGLNRVGGHEENRLTTGKADALSTATTARLNQTTLGHDTDSIRVDNRASVRNTSVVIANSGLNSVGGHEENSLTTGEAISTSEVTVSDVNVTGFGH